MFESIWSLVYLNYHGWWCFYHSDFILYSNQIKLTWQGLSEMLLVTVYQYPHHPGNTWSQGPGSDVLAGPGLRRAPGGLGLHRGRELLREIPCVFLSRCYMLHLQDRHLTLSFPIPQVFQTFLVSFNEQRRPIMPLLTAMRRTQQLSEEQRALREAWDSLTEKVGSTLICCPTLVSSSLTFSLLLWNVMKFSVSLFFF